MQNLNMTKFGNERKVFGLVAIGALICLLTITAVAYGQSDPCIQNIDNNTTVNGTLESDCTSSNRRGNYARFFTISPSQQANITITLESTDFDTYLYLMEGNRQNGAVVDEDDDHEGSQDMSQITANLRAGDYTIEVTAYSPELGGAFALTIDGLPAAAEPTPTPQPTAQPTPSPTNISVPGATATPVVPTPTNTPTPLPSPGTGTGGPLSALASGPGHVCVLYNTGQVGCRTVAASGETSPTVARLTAPVGDPFVGITTGDNHVCALTARDVLICEGLTVTPPAITPSDGSLSGVIENVRPSVVKISNNAGQGSGVIFRVENGTAYAVTNEHVVGDSPNVFVIVRDSEQISGTVTGADAQRDLAVVSFPCSNCQPVGFADSRTANVGDRVFAVGYPLHSLQPTAVEPPDRIIVPGAPSVTQGTISAFRYNTELDVEYVQTDTPINPGNSGGPLFSTEGLILGINTYIISSADGGSIGLNYAILETTVQEQLPSLLSPAPTLTDPGDWEPYTDADEVTTLLGSYETGPGQGWAIIAITCFDFDTLGKSLSVSILWENYVSTSDNRPVMLTWDNDSPMADLWRGNQFNGRFVLPRFHVDDIYKKQFIENLKLHDHLSFSIQDTSGNWHAAKFNIAGFNAAYAPVAAFCEHGQPASTTEFSPDDIKLYKDWHASNADWAK